MRLCSDVRMRDFDRTTMAQQGAALQSYNQELVKSIEELKKKRSVLSDVIKSQEVQKQQVETEIERLSVQLQSINENLAKNQQTKAVYEKTISEAEAAYAKILESSQILLNMVKRETGSLEPSQ